MNARLLPLLLTLTTPLMAAEPVSEDANRRGPVWVDVRSAEEYQQDHLPGRCSFPTPTSPGVTERFPNRETRINLYGQDGRRSRMAMEALQALGYHRVEDFGSLSALRGSAPPAPSSRLQPAGHTLPAR
ncbi:rhodanese-like domain-containing protein [Oceanimonas sp. NS1]|nr:rhodanese-like domain-containing protein [Oceanimonas sp. NS1]